MDTPSRRITTGTFDYTEVYEDPTLAAYIQREEPVKFRVIEDEWDTVLGVRVIKSVEILSVG